MCGGSALGLSSSLAVLTEERSHEDRVLKCFVVTSAGKAGSQTSGRSNLYWAKHGAGDRQVRGKLRLHNEFQDNIERTQCFHSIYSTCLSHTLTLGEDLRAE